MSNLAFETASGGHDAGDGDVAAMRDLRPVPRISIQAFCETESIANPIGRAAADRRMAKAHLKVHMGGIATAIEFYQTAQTPNLIIVESREEPKQLIASLTRMSEVCDPSSKVVVIGHYNDVWLYRELIRYGISEYIVAPVSMADILSVITSIFVAPDADPIGKSIAFIGAKGGVGSSTIAHNVGWTMSTLFSSEVVVADLDLAFGTANINFDQDPAQGIAEAVFSPERIDEHYLDRLLAQCAERLSLLAAPSMLDRTYDFDPEAFTQIIDIAQRTAPLANLRNTKNLMDTLRKLRPNDGPPKLVINMAGIPKRPEISADDFAEPLDITPMAVIPFEPALFGNSANNGRMLGEMEPQNAIVKTVNEIAHILTGRAEVKSKKKAGLGDLLTRLKLKK
jgi:pilus assembly protein CpaE